jgi:hypothetical protein
VRHRAKPSFTVEIKRAAKRVPMSEGGGHRSQPPRRPLFPELVLPPADSEPVPLTRPSAEPVVTVAPQPVRRVLPDLSISSVPAANVPDENAELEPRNRAPRGRRKAARDVHAAPVVSIDRAQRKKPERVAVESDAVSKPQPVSEQDARPAAVVPAATTLVQPAEPTGSKRGKRHGLSQIALRKAKRQGLPAPALGPGERWKRRLPLACR